MFGRKGLVAVFAFVILLYVVGVLAVQSLPDFEPESKATVALLGFLFVVFSLLLVLLFKTASPTRAH